MQNTQVASIIKTRCKEKNISVNKMLMECKAGKGLIYDLEVRDITPSTAKMEKIADYLECSIDFLVGRTDKPEINK